MIFVIGILKFLSFLIPLLIAVAYLTLVERKVLATLQRRRGPNVVGFFGILQPLADGLKLFLKETIIPYNANSIIFLMAPLITFSLSIINWLVIPFNFEWVLIDINLGLLYLFSFSSLSIYGIVLSGWSSNSKYAFLGSLRASAQMVSYEISLGIILLNVILCSGTLNLTKIVLGQTQMWYFIPLFPACLLFFFSILAETNRPPFDLPEAEAELVAGYIVEYSAMSFAFFFLAEYSNIILMNILFVILFFGGWLPFPWFLFFLNISPLFFKVFFFLFTFIWVRASLPRYRYDQLMTLGWKVFLPISLSIFFFSSSLLFSFCIWVK
jgi:NADH-quinone oxidoreductase subunit H